MCEMLDQIVKEVPAGLTFYRGKVWHSLKASVSVARLEEKLGQKPKLNCKRSLIHHSYLLVEVWLRFSVKLELQSYGEDWIAGGFNCTRAALDNIRCDG